MTMILMSTVWGSVDGSARTFREPSKTCHLGKMNVLQTITNRSFSFDSALRCAVCLRRGAAYAQTAPAGVAIVRRIRIQ